MATDSATAVDALREHLSPAQRREFEKTGVFHVQGSKGGTYCVGYAFNVVFREQRLGFFGLFKSVWTHGIWVTGAVPKEDHMLAQKLLLEADEQEFRSIACCGRFYG